MNVHCDPLHVPTIRGDTLCIKITQQEYELAFAESQQKLHGRLILNKRTRLLPQRKPTKVVETLEKQPIHGVWSLYGEGFSSLLLAQQRIFDWSGRKEQST